MIGVLATAAVGFAPVHANGGGAPGGPGGGGGGGGILVNIDIKPGSFPNAINPGSDGVIPVAILTTGSFDATTVNATTVTFGPNLAPAVKSSIQDVNGDGIPDMVLQFTTQNTGIACGQTSATLTGLTNAGVPIQGSDSIKTVPCK